jgi:hypothetical protein
MEDAMLWAAVWAWIVTILQWSFYVFLFFVGVKWWLRSAADHVKLRYIETKLDALLSDSSIDFAERLRPYIAEILRDQGERRAVGQYMSITGNDINEAEAFVKELSDAGNEDEGSRLPPPHDILDREEIHRLVDEVFEPPHRRPRRKRK